MENLTAWRLSGYFARANPTRVPDEECALKDWLKDKGSGCTLAKDSKRWRSSQTRGLVLVKPHKINEGGRFEVRDSDSRLETPDGSSFRISIVKFAMEKTHNANHGAILDGLQEVLDGLSRSQRLKSTPRPRLQAHLQEQAYLNISANHQPTTRLLVRGVRLKLSPGRFSSDEISRNQPPQRDSLARHRARYVTSGLLPSCLSLPLPSRSRFANRWVAPLKTPSIRN